MGDIPYDHNNFLKNLKNENKKFRQNFIIRINVY